MRVRPAAQETKKTTKMDLTDTSMTFAATPPVEGFRFLLLSRAMTGEKKKNPQDELVIAFLRHLKGAFSFANSQKSSDSNAK